MNDLEKKINTALDEIRPFLLNDGGDVELVSCEKGIVKVRLLGACHSCNINKMTLKNGIEATIKKYAPQVTEVIAIS